MSRDQSLAETISGGYELDWEDDFSGPRLDRSRWLPYYLPQWSSRELSAARYRLETGRLELLIEHRQPPWCPQLDGETRVSSLQTGVFAGPVGSGVGQHRFRREALVREAQRTARLYTPRYGLFALRARLPDEPNVMAALWMIGYEDQPERSAEICVCEVFGREVEPDHAIVGVGVHPFGDATIEDDFAKVRLAIDVRELHEYAAEWAPGHVQFFVDGRPVRRVEQSPAYPMQFMLGIYEFGPQSDGRDYPKRFVVESFRAYRPAFTSAAAPEAARTAATDPSSKRSDP